MDTEADVKYTQPPQIQQEFIEPLDVQSEVEIATNSSEFIQPLEPQNEAETISHLSESMVNAYQAAKEYVIFNRLY